MAFIKALIPAFLLTWIVSSVVGSTGTRGGVLALQHTYFEGFSFYWSWPLFCVAAGLGWALFLMIDS